MLTFRRVAVAIGLIAVVGCQGADDSAQPTGVSVTPARPFVETAERRLIDEGRMERSPIEVAPAETAQGGDTGPEAPWVGRLRKVCEELEAPESRTTRHTEGWETWQDKLDVSVADMRLYSPQFRKWTLGKVDNSEKSGTVRHRGPFYGFGLTVEVENKSDQVLQGDNIYVWATFKSKTGERVCFADAEANRSWNPFARKGVGGWGKEKEFSEWPLRPMERKRYTITRTSCFTSLFIETEPTEITIDVFVRFRPLGGTAVIAGPMKSFTRPGGLLRGLPLAGASTIQRLNTRRGPVPVQALYAAADYVLVAEDRKSRWVPIDTLAGVTPDNPPKTEALPPQTEDLTKTYGNLTLKINNWRYSSWRNFGGKLKQGHKLLTADVEISVDTTSIRSALEAAVNTANEGVAAAEAEVAAKEAGVGVANTTLESVRGTEGEAQAKADLKAAVAAFKLAGKALAAARKGQTAALRAMAGGVTSFLKVQAKQVVCSSFLIDVGRGRGLKMFKESTLNNKACKPLLAGETVRGQIAFDLQRWDLPFVLSWKGPGGALQTHRIASEALGVILRD